MGETETQGQRLETNDPQTELRYYGMENGEPILKIRYSPKDDLKPVTISGLLKFSPELAFVLPPEAQSEFDPRKIRENIIRQRARPSLAHRLRKA